MVRALFSYYSFRVKFYHQRGGGPIGLRGTAAVARVVIHVFDVICLFVEDPSMILNCK